jgi:hypothetical protein
VYVYVYVRYLIIPHYLDHITIIIYPHV